MSEAAVITGAGIERLRVFCAKQALEIYISSEGQMEVTRGGTQTALRIVAGYTGKTYKRSMAGKHEALADAEDLLSREGR